MLIGRLLGRVQVRSVEVRSVEVAGYPDCYYYKPAYKVFTGLPET